MPRENLDKSTDELEKELREAPSFENFASEMNETFLAGEGEDCGGVRWWAETGDLAPRLGTRRYVTRVQVSVRLDPGAALRLSLSYDGGPWLWAGTLGDSGRRIVTLPVPARRCGRLRLRLEGVGGMELHGLSWLTEAGSDV